MSRASYFFVYFRGPATLDDAEKALRKKRMLVARDDDGLVAHRGGPKLYVGLNDASYVAIEAKEDAERFDVRALASCDRRFEVGFDDLDEVIRDTNTLMEVEERLQDLTRGYILLAWNGELLEPEG